MVFMFSRQQDLCLPSLEATSPFVLSLPFDWFIAFFLVVQIGHCIKSNLFYPNCIHLTIATNIVQDLRLLVVLSLMR